MARDPLKMALGVIAVAAAAGAAIGPVHALVEHTQEAIHHTSITSVAQNAVAALTGDTGLEQALTRQEKARAEGTPVKSASYLDAAEKREMLQKGGPDAVVVDCADAGYPRLGVLNRESTKLTGSPVTYCGLAGIGGAK